MKLTKYSVKSDFRKLNKERIPYEGKFPFYAVFILKQMKRLGVYLCDRKLTEYNLR